MGLRIGDNGMVPLLPFALEKLEIIQRCPKVMWALIRYSKGNKNRDIRKIDFDLSDENGNICVRIKGLLSRAFEGEAAGPILENSVGTLLFEPVLEEQDVNPAADESMPFDSTAGKYKKQIVIFCEPEVIFGDISQEELQTQIQNGLQNNHTEVYCLILSKEQRILKQKATAQHSTEPPKIGERFETYALQIFEEVQKIFLASPSGKVLVQLVVPNQKERRLFSGFTGILNTAQVENPKLFGQLLEIESEENIAGIIQKLLENRQAPNPGIYLNRIKYQKGK